MRPNSQNLYRGFGDASTAASYLLTGLVIWGGAGFMLDRFLGTGPALFIVGMIVGNVGGIYLAYLRMTRRMADASRKESGHAA